MWGYGYWAEDYSRQRQQLFANTWFLFEEQEGRRNDWSMVNQRKDSKRYGCGVTKPADTAEPCRPLKDYGF